jgi:hypothetical protein
MSGDFLGNVRGNVAPAGVNGLDYLAQFLPDGSLDQIRLRARLESAAHIHIALRGREDDKARLREVPPDLFDDINSIAVRQAKIHHRHIRFSSTERVDCLFGGFRFGDDLQIGIALDQGNDALSHDGMIVDAQNHNPLTLRQKDSLILGFFN